MQRGKTALTFLKQPRGRPVLTPARPRDAVAHSGSRGACDVSSPVLGTVREEETPGSPILRCARRQETPGSHRAAAEPGAQRRLRRLLSKRLLERAPLEDPAPRCGGRAGTQVCVPQPQVWPGDRENFRLPGHRR